MSGYFGHSIFPLVTLSQWVRYWLLLRLYPKKVYFVGKKPYLTEPLTTKEKAVIFGVHVLLLGALFTVTILVAVGIIRWIYS